MKNKTTEERNYSINARRNVMLYAAKGMALALVVVLFASCGKKEGGSEADSLAESAGTGEEAVLDWQGQYDLGMRLLGEGNYEEAVIAFSAAIEIEPKRAAAYMARGDAYIALGERASGEESMENLASDAASDYGYAIELLNAWYGDGAWENAADTEQAWMFPENMTYSDAVSRMVELYQQLAADYAAKEDYEAAAEALRRAQELLDGCVAEEDGTAEMPGVDKALLEELLEEIREQLQGYENPEDGSAVERNAYGAPIFQQREGYEDYETMSAERREMVDRLAELALSGDVQGLEPYLADSSSIGEADSIYTEKEGYRILIERYYGMEGERYSIFVEIREENGVAKSCFFSHSEADAVIDDRIFASGSSRNWQWDGQVVVEWKTQTVHDDGAQGVYDVVETGMMKDGLREGLFQRNGISEFHGEYYEDTHEIAEFVSYEKGACSVELENGTHTAFHDAMGLTRGMDDDGSWVWAWIFW